MKISKFELAIVYDGHRLFFLALDYNSIQLEDIKHELILENIVFICHVS